MIDPAFATILVALVINIPTLYLLLENKRKVKSDAYESLSTALQTSGKTIDDLFRMLAEVPALKQQLEEMQDELDDLRLGVGILTTQLLKRNIQPEWHPRAIKVNHPQNPKRKSGLKQ